MFKKRPKILPVFVSCVAASLCFLCVCFAVLAKPKAKTADILESKIEYKPQPKSTEYITLCCAHGCNFLLVLDFEQQAVSLLSSQCNESVLTAKIEVDEALISALCDNAGGVDFVLPYDTALLKAGSWRLTGSQVWELLHCGDTVLKEQLLCEFFDKVFMFGLKNDQIYIILEEGICDNLSYSRLYDIALASKEWLSNLTVIS